MAAASVYSGPSTAYYMHSLSRAALSAVLFVSPSMHTMRSLTPSSLSRARLIKLGKQYPHHYGSGYNVVTCPYVQKWKGKEMKNTLESCWRKRVLLFCCWVYYFCFQVCAIPTHLNPSSAQTVSKLICYFSELLKGYFLSHLNAICAHALLYFENSQKLQSVCCMLK